MTAIEHAPGCENTGDDGTGCNCGAYGRVQTYTLGQPVLFTHHLVRRSRWDTTQRHTAKRWDAATWSTGAGPAVRGVIIGARTLSNGHTEHLGYEEGNAWVGVHYFTAYLVAWHLRRKPVLVLPEHLTARTPVPEPSYCHGCRHGGVTPHAADCPENDQETLL